MPRPLRPSTVQSLTAALLLGTAWACTPAATPAAGPAAATTDARTDWTIPDIGPPQPVGAQEHAARRAAIAEAMGEGVLVVFGSDEPAADYLPYAQNSPFMYLTGIVEPGAALVIERDGARVEEWIFVLPRDPAREIWEGPRLGPEGARERTGVRARTSDRALPVADSLLSLHGVLHTVVGVPDREDAILSPAQQRLRALLERNPGTSLRSVNQELRRLRAEKSPAELDMIRRATYVTNLAHREAMRAVAPGMNEFEIRGLVEYLFMRYGADGPAYSSIVGSGPNATILHYRDADRYMSAGELLLMDVAASYRGYASDVTRTFPVDGTFTGPQREIYRIVLDAQKAAEERLRLGATWSELSQAATEVLARGLAQVGLIDAPDATYICDRPADGDRCPQLRLFYMHGLGHGVGLDVHDPDISQFEGFQPGSAVTIEPGVYVRSDVFDHIPDVPENREMARRLAAALDRYRDIGVRIEDVYIFDDAGVERASAGPPREIEEIEALMREPSRLAAERRAEVVEWYRATDPDRPR